MFIVCLRGGLGNQLFQYAFGVFLEEKFREKVVFNHYYLHHDTDGREYRLNHMNIQNQKVLNKAEELLFSYYYKLKLKFYEKKLPSKEGLLGEESFNYLSSKGLLITKDMFKYFKIIKMRKGIKFVDGFFQTEKYFNKYIDRIKSEFTISTNCENKNIEMLNQIKASKSSVCLHIRLGDYRSEKWIKQVNICNADYYREAMKYIAGIINNPKFFIFTNSGLDIEWIKLNYTFDYEVQYVDLNNTDIEDFRLMCNCNNFILSNSSFSWWASYLSNNENKLIVAPSNWHKSDLYEGDLYMNNWIVIDVK